MIRGTTMNVALSPVGAKQLLPAETFAPAHLELHNGLRTDSGFYRSRPGYVAKVSLGVQQAITLLVPSPRTDMDIGFAVTEQGQVYELHEDYTSSLMTGPTLNGEFRPTWCKFDTTQIICDGQAPIKIASAGTTTALLGGGPPAARYCAVIADRVILSGYNDTEFVWSDPGNAETWPGGNVSAVTGHGEQIRFMQERDTDLFFFKDVSIEVWSHIGGIEVFGRRGIVTFADKRSMQRPTASFSVVLAGGTFHWYANGDFWRLNGMTPEPISRTYKRAIESVSITNDCYGFNFQREHVVRWFFPTEARCFVYDYWNQVFTEDHTWRDGEAARLPIFAYMEVGKQAWIGDYDPTGTISQWSDDVFTDNGRDIRVNRTLRVLLSPEGVKASVNRARLRIERGQGAVGTEPGLLARWRFDEGDWTPYSTVPIGTAGDRDPYIDLVNVVGGRVLGKGRELTLELIQTAPVRHLMTHLNLTIQTLGR